MSLTMTLNVNVREPPKLSFTTYDTKFVPTGKVEPLAGVLVTLVTTQPSIDGTLQVTLLLLHWPKSAFAVMLGGFVKSTINVSTVT